MQEFSKALHTRLVKKHFATQSIGALALHVLRKHACTPEKISGYIRHGVLFVVLGEEEDKTKWFMQKKPLLEEVNTMIQGVHHQYSIQDIRRKQG